METDWYLLTCKHLFNIFSLYTGPSKAESIRITFVANITINPLPQIPCLHKLITISNQTVCRSYIDRIHGDLLLDTAKMQLDYHIYTSQTLYSICLQVIIL